MNNSLIIFTLSALNWCAKSKIFSVNYREKVNYCLKFNNVINYKCLLIESVLLNHTSESFILSMLFIEFDIISSLTFTIDFVVT